MAASKKTKKKHNDTNPDSPLSRFRSTKSAANPKSRFQGGRKPRSGTRGKQ